MAHSLILITFTNACVSQITKKILLEFVLRVLLKTAPQILIWFLELGLVLAMLGITEVTKGIVFQYAKKIKFLAEINAFASKDFIE